MKKLSNTQSSPKNRISQFVDRIRGIVYNPNRTETKTYDSLDEISDPTIRAILTPGKTLSGLIEECSFVDLLSSATPYSRGTI